uniref:Uncharacterized protein n=1 Tax=Arundo donax TaxID=35708 RepID=A0A0A9EGM9_ARUDO
MVGARGGAASGVENAATADANPGPRGGGSAGGSGCGEELQRERPAAHHRLGS